MASPALPVLYSFRRCPYAMRARLAIAASGLCFELREVMLRGKPPELLAASPKATVPVLVLPGGEVIEQSLDIMLWALRQNDSEGWLAPPHATLEEMLALIAANDGNFKQHLDRYKYPNRFPREHAGDERGFAQAHRSGGANWLAALDIRLARQPWLTGNTPSLADMAILPFVRQFAHTDRGWFEAQSWPHLRVLLTRWESSDALPRVMEKYPPWRSGQASVIFPPEPG